MLVVSILILVACVCVEIEAIGVNDMEGGAFVKAFPEAKLIQQDFGIGGRHGERHPELWFKGAGLIVPQMNRIIDFVSPGFKMDALTVEEGHEYYRMRENNANVQLLGQQLNRFRSDKAVFYQHYHHVYAGLIEDLGGRQKPLRYLEIGMGTNNSKLVSTMGAGGSPGASLRAFSEYLPNSQIYGADVDRDILFQNEEMRIQTTYIDGFNISTYDDMYERFGSSKFDLIIDDAAHAVASDLNTLIFALGHVNVPGFIVIEDVNLKFFPSFRVVNYLLRTRVNDDIVVKSHMVFTAHRKHGKGNPHPFTKTYIFVISLQKKA